MGRRVSAATRRTVNHDFQSGVARTEGIDPALPCKTWLTPYVSAALTRAAFVEAAGTVVARTPAAFARKGTNDTRLT
jgi:hypothetical protein